jgi:acyl-coenzyme A synthetase/AMP-(fatty) acid ligase
MARMLVANDETRTALTSIRHMLVGGEAFPPDLATELEELVQDTVTNMYGPTETTIWSATWRVPGAVGSVPIGHPIANTSLYVLDENRQPLPPGVPGELYIGGDGVVRGYHGREELTKERFLPDPFEGVTEKGRMYRTGDLVRLQDDGTVEFLSRTDHQVKVRGYRIELGEIETVLARHDDVRETVVVAREDTPGNHVIVAYVVPAGSLDIDVLREALRETLPEYMVPSTFVSLDALPLSPNGKINRLALPAPQALAKKSKKPFVPPQNELEETLADLWKEALGIESVGVDDNFFDIGGHSLLVVRLHRTIAGVVDSPVTLTDLYRFPTIRSLCEHLASGGAGADARIDQSVDRARKRRETMQARRRRRA